MRTPVVVDLVAVPSLDAVAHEPGVLAKLSADAVLRLLTTIEHVRVDLLAAYRADVIGNAIDAHPISTSNAEPDRLLTPAEAAQMLGVTLRWLHRHAKTLPFTRRLTRKCLRFSEVGLRRWQAARRP